VPAFQRGAKRPPRKTSFVFVIASLRPILCLLSFRGLLILRSFLVSVTYSVKENQIYWKNDEVPELEKRSRKYRKRCAYVRRTVANSGSCLA
jgi:hypothetical protein